MLSWTCPLVGRDWMDGQVQCPAPILVDRDIRTQSFELSSNQTDDLKIDTCRFLARLLALLG